MPRKNPLTISLELKEKEKLEAVTRKYTSPNLWTKALRIC